MQVVCLTKLDVVYSIKMGVFLDEVGIFLTYAICINYVDII